MPTIESRLERLGLVLPDAPAPLASYVPATTLPGGTLALISGQVPLIGGQPMATGAVPDQVPIDVAIGCARQCALNGLAALRNEIGSLDRLRRVARLDGFVACGPGFGDQPRIINGASDLLVELLGDAGRHTRAAVGVSSLPLNVPVEIAFTFVVD